MTTSDEAFWRFGDAYPDHAIYLATDNAATQRAFVERFGGRVCGLKPIRPHTTSRLSLQRHTSQRHTSLQDAVVDLYTCAAASVFQGCLGSSFSDTIAHLRIVQGTAHPDDRHSLLRPGKDWVDPTPSHVDITLATHPPAAVASENYKLLAATPLPHAPPHRPRTTIARWWRFYFTSTVRQQ